jgi:hypothetical protein
MKWETARALSSQWIRAAGAQRSAMQSASDWLTFELAGVLADDAQTGIATAEEQAAIVALSGESLLIITWDQQEAGVIIATRRLSTHDADVAISSTIDPDDPQSRERRWVLAASSIELVTSEGFYGGFATSSGPSDAERVLRAYARQAGWPIPEEDPGLEML